MPVQVKRGDVVLVPFPNSNLRSAKLRPALVIQSDHLDSELPQISSNLGRVGRQPRVEIGISSDLGRASGLLTDSVVMTDNIATVRTSELVRVIGRISDMSDVDRALVHTLGLQD